MAPSEPVDLRSRWHHAWERLGCAPPAGERERLLARYAETHRAYHNVRHLQECFQRYDRVADQAVHPAEVELALWYHDAVYDPRSDRNEEASAALAAAALRDANGPAESVERIRALIMATRHDTQPAPGDAALLVDVDLGILAAEPERFAEYEAEVRKEYAWVPDPLYVAGRREVLEKFLRRPAIYATEWFRARDEARARHNLQQALERLRG